MSISISNPSYDKVYTAYAWRYNSIFLNMTQGEGIEDTGVVWNDDGTIDQSATAQTSVTADHVKAPRFQLRDDRGILDLTGCQVVLAVKRPKGTEDLLACYIEGNASDGTISCPITRSATAIEGRGLGEIRVISNNAIIKFYGIHFNIYEGISDLAAEQSTQFAALVSALQKIALVNPDGSNTVDMDTEVTENGTNPVASGVLYDFVYSVFNDGSKVSYVTNATVDNATETGKVYYTTVGSSKALIVPVSGDSSQVQFRLDRDGKIYARRRSRSSTSVDFPAWGIFEQTGWTSAEISAMIDNLVDPTLSVQGKAADAREVGDKLDGVPFDLTFTTSDVIDNCFIGADGAQVAAGLWLSTDYCYVPLEKGGTLEITSTIYVNGGVAFYDQNKTCLRAITGQNAAEYDYAVSSLPKTRTFVVPKNTAYVRISALKSTPEDMGRVSLLRIRKGVGLNQVVNELGSLMTDKANAEELAELKNTEPVEFIDGCFYHVDWGELVASPSYKCAKINVSLLRGGHVSLATYTDGSRIGIGFVDPDGALIEGFASAAGVYNFDSDIPENAAYLYVSVKKAQESKFTAPVFTWGSAFMQAQSDDVQNLHVNNQYARTTNALCPVLRDGTPRNVGNAVAVHTRFLSKIDNRYDYVEIRFIGKTEGADHYAFSYTAYDENASEEMVARAAYADNSIAKNDYNIELTTKTTEPYIRIPLSELTGYQYISATVELYNGSQPITLRTDSDQYCLKITYKNHIITDDIADGAVTSDKLDLEIGSFEFIDGCYYHVNWGELVAASTYKCAKINVSLLRGGHVSLTTYTDGGRIGIGFVDPDGALIEGFASAAGVYNFDSDIPENAAYLYVSVKKSQESKFIAPVFTWGSAFMQAQSDDAQNLYVNNQYVRTADSFCPTLKDGTVRNEGNDYAVYTKFLSKIDNRYDYVEIRFIGEAEGADHYAFSCTAYDENASEGMTARAAYADNSIVKKDYNIELTAKTTEPYIRIPLSELTGYQYISATVQAFNGSQLIPLRIAGNQYCLKITYKYQIITDDIADGAVTSDKLDPDIEIGLTRRDVMNNETKSLLLQSRHVGGDPEASDYAPPLTLLHFSDIHADADALNRIYSDCEDMDIDDKICTGDIVNSSMAWITSSEVTYNPAQDIPNWWKPDIMITVGNHDTAAYDGVNRTLIWNYLTMAQCDQYLIAPFEANWGVTHTAGTSYYYKDYTDSKVRLIVIDGMLYDVEGSQDAAAQTAWLGNLLDGAITNGLHVLIATHGIATGAHTKSCTFSKRGTYTSAQTIWYTPPVITELVRTKINNGLHFVGYLCGHTHQDYVWDVYNDGTQLMYCITCATTNVLQSRNSDQSRDATADAYNLVTIDTKNQLVKLIRGGGADSDKYHRNRKAICFHYGTGEIYGE